MMPLMLVRLAELQNCERAQSEHQRLNNELRLDRKDESRMEPRKNFKGWAMLSAETTVLSDEQFAGKRGNSQKKAKGRSPSAFQGYTPEAPMQQVEYIPE